MDIDIICKYVPSHAMSYYIVFDGQRAGIYTEHDQAEEAAWYSTERVETVKSRSGAISAFKRHQRK